MSAVDEVMARTVAAVGETVRVRVREGWAVHHDGRHRTNEVLEVPTPVAVEWLRAGLIERTVPASPRVPARR